MIAIILPLLLACGGTSKLPMASLQVGSAYAKVELAITHETRQYGLMMRDSMPTNSGMLFVYPDVKPRSFWMKDTRIPLSIAFADADGKIVKIADMKPFVTQGTKSLYPAKYALEMNKGWFDTNNVKKGDVIQGIPDLDVQ